MAQIRSGATSSRGTADAWVPWLSYLGIAKRSGNPSAPEILDMGTSLAALAIDNRRFYEGLIHRS